LGSNQEYGPRPRGGPGQRNTWYTCLDGDVSPSDACSASILTSDSASCVAVAPRPAVRAALPLSANLNEAPTFSFFPMRRRWLHSCSCRSTEDQSISSSAKLFVMAGSDFSFSVQEAGLECIGVQRCLHKFRLTSLRATFYSTCCDVDCCQRYSCLQYCTVGTASLE